jgi:thiol-disulfide isomerase/thioredoxin
MRTDHTGVSGVRVFVAAVFLLAAVGFAVIRVAGGGGEPDVSRTRHDPAPAFADVTAWINSGPLTIPSLRGKVVLIDFWTYSCINCLRTIPGLRSLYARYKDAGLEIVGVHSPEFSFEKVQSNVRQAATRLGVTWPVAMDNDMATWRAYKNNYWPHVYLIDRTGVIVYDKIGEGDEAQLEQHLRSVLAQGGHVLPSPVAVVEPSFAPGMTPEIYAGYQRGEESGSVANREGYARDRVLRYGAPSAATLAAAANDGAFYLSGTWTARSEHLDAGSDARLFLPFFARDVFVVASSASSSAVRVLLDGTPVSSPGADVAGGAVTVGASRLYALVHLKAAGRHVLELDAAPGFALYSFTFG